MLQIIYASAATAPMGSADLDALLAQARDCNLRSDVTGMLLYDDGSFLQVIEGPDGAVSSLYERIRHDSRHDRIRLLSTKTVAFREFGDWAMAYARPEGAEAAGEGFLDYEGEDEQLGFDTSEAAQLLNLFHEGLLRQAADVHPGQCTITIKARDPRERQRNYLLNLGRALALAAPEISIGVVTPDGTQINYNLHRDLEKGEAELF